MRWIGMGVFTTIMTELAAQAPDTGIVMIDVAHAKAHRAGQGRYQLETACRGRCEGLPDPEVPVGRPDVGPHRRAGTPVVHPSGRALHEDRGYDADLFRNALIAMAISPCIPSRRGRNTPILHDADLYRQRHKIENMVARLRDWRRIATRYDRCPILFLSACALAATVIDWSSAWILAVRLGRRPVR
jgi:transposase